MTKAPGLGFRVKGCLNMVFARVLVFLLEKTYIPTPVVVNLQNIRLMGGCRFGCR